MRGGHRQSGQATVEFALVGLLLVFVIIGLFEAGRAVLSYNALAQATREGARYAIVHGSRSDDPSGPGSGHYTSPDQDAMVTQVVLDHTSMLDADRLAVSAEWLDGTNERGSRVEVTAEYEFHTTFASVIGIGDFTLTSSSTMTISY